MVFGFYVSEIRTGDLVMLYKRIKTGAGAHLLRFVGIIALPDDLIIGFMTKQFLLFFHIPF